MCGIVGVAGTAAIANRSWLALGRDAMRHRGPDDAGEWWSHDGRVGLGHRRLAIIDLSPRGHQPMQDIAGDLCIVFNGEIYNHSDLRRELDALGHVFRTQSDTEVILAAYREWGEECLARLNGMFAFALYDHRRRVIFAARDRAGEKPFFYALRDGEFRFASELKGLMADPSTSRRIARDALDCYLLLGFVPGDRCILQGANKLPPAHALIFTVASGDLKLWRYWNPPALATSQVSNESLLDELEELLGDAVKRQLVADVPVGVLLSGGLDSSLVTAMAARATSSIKSFTVRFPGHSRYDETEHARLISRHFGTEHVELVADIATVDLLPQLARQFDEPMVDSSMIPTYLVSKLVRDHCTVALGGDGGDELFGGYPHYSRLLWLYDTVLSIPRPARVTLAQIGTNLLPVGFKGRNWLQGLSVDFRTELPLIASLFDQGTRRQLLKDQSGWTLVAEDIRDARIPKGVDLLQRATRMDFENYLPEDILVKVDRASMLNSLEIRAPLLDHRLLEFAFQRVPSEYKATSNSRKVLLKQLASRVLPKEFDKQRKQGFSVPLASWLQSGPWHTFFREVLLSSNSGFFNRSVITSLLDGQARGRSNGERLFALVLFELWRIEYGVSM